MRDSKNTPVYFFENFPAVKFDVRVIEKLLYLGFLTKYVGRENVSFAYIFLLLHMLLIRIYEEER